MSESHDRAPASGIGSYVPSEIEIDALIASATTHPLGLRFLLEGHLGSVATTFGAHAFTVDAARDRLRRAGQTTT
jgi:hypothetical protein